MIRWSAERSKLALGLSDDERVLHCLPTEKVGGLMLIIRSVLYNWHLSLYKPEANPMLKIKNDHDFSFVSLVPYQMANIMNHPKSAQKLKRFNTVLLGGAAISEALENQIHTFMTGNTVQVFHSYGMTETASHVALRNLRTMEPNSFALLDDVEVSLNDSGCMRFMIPAIGHDVQTKDLGILKDRTIQFLSREDDVVNSGGVKLHLYKIESKINGILKENNLAIRYFLWKKMDDALGEKLVFVGLKNDKQMRIVELLQQNLPKFEIPKDFYWVEGFERTESGKIDRRKTLQRLVEIGS